jgi:tetratricopeptide (TPR) repeat protein
MKDTLLLFIFSLIFIIIGCNKENATHTSIGSVYKSKNLDNKNTRSSYNLDIQQINGKLSPMSNDDRFQFALKSGNEGRYQEALAAYNVILESDKNYPDIYYYQGLLYRDIGLLDEAVCAFQTAIQQNPNSAEAHYNLGYAYRGKGLQNEAIAEYKKVLKLMSNNKSKQIASVHYNLGLSYFSKGMFDEAVNEYNKALALKPKNKEIHQKLGIAYTAKGWTDKAKDEFSIFNRNEKTNKKIP